jgi:hypothetical protein
MERSARGEILTLLSLGLRFSTRAERWAAGAVAGAVPITAEERELPADRASARARGGGLGGERDRHRGRHCAAAGRGRAAEAPSTTTTRLTRRAERGAPVRVGREWARWLGCGG